ncbi:hypothetical protein LO771_21305 [Streptacidiphilus sp. ASG 303]|uniref:hypothetical protein n=1 Tax=Streptacidiphilus sp. ASG 303 TaxID=2896847 RepID=UPI001E4E014F|nr:hypothetical protein [Streptacidiphilus sp. ASG 303]MCD0484858.1 hypothetical protein [Streptacidiphilus sp. ASG 303]
MVTDVWGVLDEKQRLSWVFTPFERVGPLEFGMTHEQAEAAGEGVLRTALREGSSGDGIRVDFWLEQRPDARFSGPAVTVYYDRSVRLSGIAVNALRGPQVTLDGMRLVGQVPSRLEERFIDYLGMHDKELRYSQCADPCSAQLGLVLRAQRAGDLVLSRPVMVSEAWADRCWDTTEGCIPEREWKTFEW